MKSTVETLSPTRVRLAVEVPFGELKPSLDRAYKSIAQQVRVPGFRPGKAPARIIDQRVGRGTVLNEAVQDAVPRCYSEAIRENDLNVLSQPDLEVTKIEDGDVLEFTAEVDVRPEITLPDLDSLNVSVEDAEVADDEVAEQLDALRERFAMLKTADRVVQEGDFVSIDLTASADGEEIPDASTTGTSYEVGSGGMVEGLDTALSGMSAEESKTFTSELVGGDRAGEEADITVTVRSVKEKELPELDDDFAQTASEFDTLDELRDDIRARLGRVKAGQQGTQARDRVLEALVEGVEVPLPEALVQSEVDYRRDGMVRQLTDAGLDLEGYLEAQEQSQEAFDQEMRDAAEDAVRTQIVLDTLADSQQVSVSDSDLTEHIVAEAQRYGVPPQTLAQQVQEAGNIGALVGEVRRNKAMRRALGAATVTDESGNVVDLTPLIGPSEDDADADAEVEAAGSENAAAQAADEDAEHEAALENGEADETDETGKVDETGETDEADETGEADDDVEHEPAGDRTP